VVKTNVKNVTLVVKLVMALLQATVILAYRDLPCPPAYVPPVSQPVPDVPPKTPPSVSSVSLFTIRSKADVSVSAKQAISRKSMSMESLFVVVVNKTVHSV
jgi:hypothetical protein